MDQTLNSPFVSELSVLWSDMDSNGHVNNGVYQFYFDEARMQALEEEGFSLAKMREEKVGPVMYKAELSYNKPLSHPDKIRIETTFGDVTKTRGKVFQTMRRVSDGELVCQAVFHTIFFNFNTNRPWKLPDWFIEKYS
ncbi:acyl-CoA thioesterase [Leptospira ilyithenensis]|uniref:Acyl-CoA thioesterase n=1 Tax=Leptospira ilyithenensis TaxID=2484901 RepID=A0A4R9LSP9_9LEPT|nr:acyl-CoA thioesterase [Leptospira ilyithenensis]TGN14506.1 acyl-CoA thioesterase [Leptospira ilyithenensis]